MDSEFGKSKSSSSLGEMSKKSLFYFAELGLRILVIAFSVARAVITVTSQLSVNIFGIVMSVSYIYSSSFSIVKEIVEGTPHNLLESVAQLIASTVLNKYPEVSTVRIQVGKSHVVVVGSVDYLGVEIIRHHSSAAESLS